MKILIIGSGGREHALVWKIAQSPLEPEIYCAPGNPGTANHGINVPIDSKDLKGLLAFANKFAIDLTIVGPEQPLVDGIVDLFNVNGLIIFGPTKAAAEIEGSKAFAKDLMWTYGIPTAPGKIIRMRNEVDRLYANDYVSTKGFPIVLKADGLAAGKGVRVCKNRKEAVDFYQPHH